MLTIEAAAKIKEAERIRAVTPEPLLPTLYDRRVGDWYNRGLGAIPGKGSKGSIVD